MSNLESTILGIKANPLNFKTVISLINDWVKERATGKYVVLENVFTIMNAVDDPAYCTVVKEAALAIPDGKPVAIMHKLKGFKTVEQTRGPELMYQYLKQSVNQDISHFFYGGKEGVPEKLKVFFENEFPGIKIVGTYSPPFRKLTTEEDQEICDRINQSGADILWVGLGAPKQDIWMYQHQEKLTVVVQLGIGAAFDFWIGNLKIAPKWMQTLCLEWFYRFLQEPRRLFKRYFYHNPRFIWYSLFELIS